MPEELLRDLEDPIKANELLQGSNLAVTHRANQLQIASQLVLAYKTKIAGEALAASMAALANALTEGLGNHAKALREAANSSDNHARGLNHATWALVIATGVLVLVTVAPSVMQLWRGY